MNPGLSIVGHLKSGYLVIMILASMHSLTVRGNIPPHGHFSDVNFPSIISNVLNLLTMAVYGHFLDMIFMLTVAG